VLRESIIIPGLCRRIEAHDRCSGEIQPSDVLIIDAVPATMAWRRFARYASTVTAAGSDRGKNLSGFRDVSLRDGCLAQDTP